ncbi:MAG: carboxypeptidase-like regulatory domain-containing protein, partial [Acidobacteriota bacterium]|nr:carboxypeptidase-like regulatory domain-containing protein [Acidobacteriota bacterium]
MFKKIEAVVPRAGRCIARPGWLLSLLTILLLGFGSAQFGNSQTLSSINGTVTDTSGAVIGNANVTVTNVATQVAKTAVTSSAGTYSVTDLIPGTYTVKVESAGFQLSEHKGVGVDVGRNSTVDAVLQPGNVEQTVTVSESAIA